MPIGAVIALGAAGTDVPGHGTDLHVGPSIDSLTHFRLHHVLLCANSRIQHEVSQKLSHPLWQTMRNAALHVTNAPRTCNAASLCMKFHSAGKQSCRFCSSPFIAPVYTSCCDPSVCLYILPKSTSLLSRHVPEITRAVQTA